MRASALALGCLGLYGMSTAEAMAANCTGGTDGSVSATATSLAFGTYRASNPTTTTVPFSMTLACTGGGGAGTLPPMSIALSSGAGTFATRHLSLGGVSLNYQIFSDAALSIVWGDGSGATSPVALSGGVSSQVLAGYAVISAGQWVQPGVYTDSITVTIDY
jgi:spore coat protein U-like protein